MMTNWLRRLCRRIITGKGCGDFTFHPANRQPIQETNITNLYIHIPFCRNRCPYCPYNTTPLVASEVKPFFQALRKELELYLPLLRNNDIDSIYIGGGTPTCVWEELSIFLDELKRKVRISGVIAIETNPEEITPELVQSMRQTGISMVSVGVQSFQDEALQTIGRNYPASILDEKIALLLHGGFDLINVDLMFAFGQNPEKVFARDLERAIATGAQQITAYPLFEFPYSGTGKLKKLKKLKMPNLRLRRKMYTQLFNTMQQHGFNMVSVWGFKKGSSVNAAFSSVSRDFFLGLGPGAASRYHGKFYFNTFDPTAYSQRLNRSLPPLALEMDITERLSNLYWLYWRLYEGQIPEKDFTERFRHHRRIRWLMKAAETIGFVSNDGDYFKLRENGAFWIHLLQNYYVLNYIDKVWTSATNQAFPDDIRL